MHVSAVIVSAPLCAGAEPYPRMARLEQYLMADRDGEGCPMARSAAPAAISRKRRACWFYGGRGTSLPRKEPTASPAWSSARGCLTFDHPDFWNPKLRGPVCYNAAATESLSFLSPFTGLNWSSAVCRRLRSLAQYSKPSKRSHATHSRNGGHVLHDVAVSIFERPGRGLVSAPDVSCVPRTGAARFGEQMSSRSPLMLDDQHREVPEPQAIFMSGCRPLV